EGSAGRLVVVRCPGGTVGGGEADRDRPGVGRRQRHGEGHGGAARISLGGHRVGDRQGGAGERARQEGTVGGVPVGGQVIAGGRRGAEVVVVVAVEERLLVGPADGPE